MRITDRYVVTVSVRLECYCRGASAERRSAVHAALRGVPLESRRGRHPDARRDGQLAPNAIVESLTEGTMRLQGQALSQGERIAIAELVTGRPVLAASAPVLDKGSAPRARRSRRASGPSGTAGAPTPATRAFSPTPAASPRQRRQPEAASGRSASRTSRSRARSPRSSAAACSWRANRASSTRSIPRPAARIGLTRRKPACARRSR